MFRALELPKLLDQWVLETRQHKLSMRNPGLEPGSLAAHEPESCASTNSASSARINSIMLRFNIIHYNQGVRQLLKPFLKDFVSQHWVGEGGGTKNTIQKIQGCDKKFQIGQTAANAFQARGQDNPLLAGEGIHHTEGK
jgi:hypothetical protein